MKEVIYDFFYSVLTLYHNDMKLDKMKGKIKIMSEIFVSRSMVKNSNNTKKCVELYNIIRYNNML